MDWAGTGVLTIFIVRTPMIGTVRTSERCVVTLGFRTPVSLTVGVVQRRQYAAIIGTGMIITVRSLLPTIIGHDHKLLIT